MDKVDMDLYVYVCVSMLSTRSDQIRSGTKGGREVWKDIHFDSVH